MKRNILFFTIILIILLTSCSIKGGVIYGRDPERPYCCIYKNNVFEHYELDSIILEIKEFCPDINLIIID